MSPIDFRLYLVTDRHQTAGRPLLSVLDDAVQAGVRAVQLRERDLTARELLVLAQNIQQAWATQGVRLFINDRVDLAAAISASGVHLRDSSLPPTVAKKLMRPGQLLGVSVHSVEAARVAEDSGADFLVLGPIYDTPSKREFGAPLGLRILEATAAQARIPVFGIGGVSAERARAMRQAGAHGVAVISAILNARDPAVSTRDLLAAVQ
ncbi:MAG TPA: thiamine phosphate synthase [Nitrospiraceae bacterium]|nr:thiamine phosphate synthase [Nitrospiraceae bacterium]